MATLCRDLCKNGLTDRDAVWVMDWSGPYRKHVLYMGFRSPCEGAIIRGKKRTYQGMPDDTLPRAVQKWLNRSIRRLACGLGWAEGNTSSIVFIRRCQCALMGGHIGATSHLANRIVPSVCGGDAALCQITLTTLLLF